MGIDEECTFLYFVSDSEPFGFENVTKGLLFWDEGRPGEVIAGENAMECL